MTVNISKSDDPFCEYFIWIDEKQEVELGLGKGLTNPEVFIKEGGTTSDITKLIKDREQKIRSELKAFVTGELALKHL